MNITESICDKYILSKMGILVNPTSVIGEELNRAYEIGYREYELFFEPDSTVEYILCLWTSILSYEDISKDYPEFFGYRYSCYLPTDGQDVGSFCVWDKIAGEWKVYRPRLR